MVQADQGAPLVRQPLGRLFVRRVHPPQLGRSEQFQHRQIGEPVAAVRGRVDEYDAVLRPEHVARPQIAVQPSRGGPRRSNVPAARRSMTRSRVALVRSARRANGSRRSSAYQAPHEVVAAERRASGASPIQPRPGPSSGPTPNHAAPASWVTASRRPKSSAASAEAATGFTRSITRIVRVTWCTPATATPPGTESQRNPAASASKNPSGASARRFV